VGIGPGGRPRTASGSAAARFPSLSRTGLKGAAGSAFRVFAVAMRGGAAKKWGSTRLSTAGRNWGAPARVQHALPAVLVSVAHAGARTGGERASFPTVAVDAEGARLPSPLSAER